MWRAAVLLIGICFSAASHLNIVDIETDLLPDTRIVGGEDTTIEQWPFIVQFLMNLSPRCGASLITTSHVLTAAHCLVDNSNVPINPLSFFIRAGSTTFSGGQVIQVSDYIIHAQYYTPVRDNDIGVALLTEPVTLGPAVGVASIPQLGNSLPDNSSVAYIGWGVTSAGSQVVSSILQEVYVYKVNNSLCGERYGILEEIYNSPFPVTDSMICAGVIDVGGKDACQGDSGGPLVFSTDILVGVVSWGWGCADPTYPGVNARVASYTSWIESAVEQLSDDTDNSTTTDPSVTATETSAPESTTVTTESTTVSTEQTTVIIETTTPVYDHAVTSQISALILVLSIVLTFSCS